MTAAGSPPAAMAAIRLADLRFSFDGSAGSGMRSSTDPLFASAVSGSSSTLAFSSFFAISILLGPLLRAGTVPIRLGRAD